MAANTLQMFTDMSDLCRVCLQLPEKSQYLDLTTIYDEEDNLTYAECFTVCTKIDLNDGEGVPHHLCKPCGIELQMSYDFHKKIEESKRVIQECQRQRKDQNLNNSELLTVGKNDDSLILNEQEKKSITHLMSPKNISGDEMHISHTSDSQHHSENAVPFEANEDSEEMEILNQCEPETDLQHQEPADDRCSNAEIGANFEDNFEIEALEEEEKNSELITSRELKKEALIENQQMMCKIEPEGVTEADISMRTLYGLECVKVKYETFREISDNEAQSLWNNCTYNENITENETNGEYTIPNPTVPSNEQPNESQCSVSRNFLCKLCGHLLPTKNSLYKHNQKKHKKLTHRKRKPPNSSLKCSFCPKFFYKPKSLSLHMKEHHNDLCFFCEICDHNLPTRNALYKHRLRKHPELKKNPNETIKFKCLYCPNTFSRIERLKLHQGSQHKNQTKKLNESNCLSCEYCGYELPSKSAWYQHRSKKHPNINIKILFCCKYCGSIFSSEKRLHRHLEELHETED